MNNPFLMRRRYSARNLLRILARLAHRQRPRTQPLAQRLAFQKFRDDIRRAIVLAKIMNRQDVGMIERRNRLRLLLEPQHPLRIARKRRRQHLHRHVAIEPRIPRPIHLAHAARACWCHDLVRTEFGARGERHLCAQL